MSFEESLRSISLDADSSVAGYTGVPGLQGSAVPNYGKQYRFVKVTGALTVGLAGAGEDAVGVVQNKPQATGEPATVAIHGVSNVICAGNIAAGALVKSDANGKAVTHGGTGVALGVALSAGSDGVIIPVLLQVS